MKQKKKLEIKKFDNYSKDTDNAINNMCYNFYPKQKLYASNGIRLATFPLSPTDDRSFSLDISNVGFTAIKGITYFKQYFRASGNTQYRIFIYGDDGKMYLNQLFNGDYSLFAMNNLQFNSHPMSLVYKKDESDVVIFTSTDKMIIWKANRAPYTIENVPIITSMCVNDGVLFCTIKEPAFKIWYATDLDAERIGDISRYSNYISLDDDLGYARKIVTFNEEVYIFRDFGITKLKYIKGEIYLSQVYQSNSHIISDSISVAGNVILFMTKQGLYSFNGSKANLLNIDVFTKYSSVMDNCVASSLGSKYYIALKINFGDEKQILCEQEESYNNNALIVLDTIDLSYQILRGVDVLSLMPIKTPFFEKMILTFNSVNKNLLGELADDVGCFDIPLPRYWASDNLFESLNTKMLTKLVVDAKQNMQFTLCYDGKQMNFTTYQSGINEFHFKICTKQARLQISSSQTNSQVNKVAIEYYEY